MEISLELLSGLLVLLLIIYYHLTSTYNYWKSRGVPGPKPCIPFGTTKDIITGKESIGTYTKKIYNQYRDEPMVGIYLMREPILILNDLDLIKRILIKDFNTFVDRGIQGDEEHDPLSASLFGIEEKRWRPLRSKLSPIFTSGKLREMFYLLRQCALQLDRYLEEVSGTSVDVRDIAAKFTTDVIGVCAFGIQMNALENDDSIFRQMGKRIFAPTLIANLRFKLQHFLPWLNRIIGGWFADHELTDFFINLTRDTMEHRRHNNVARHDFIDLLRKLKDEPAGSDGIELTDSLLAAQLFVFFLAGFETSSSTISSCLLELALNHEIQSKLRTEIRGELEKTDGEMTYEGIGGMKYLDKVVKETLRKYPPAPNLLREANAPYTFPGTHISISTKVNVWIPVMGIQHDPKYFPQPDVFDPERFTEEAMKSRHPMTFLPFGDGPRNCIEITIDVLLCVIGARFGTIQTKVGLIKTLEKFAVDICEKTDRSYELNRSAFLLTPKNGVFLKIAKAPLNQ